MTSRILIVEDDPTSRDLLAALLVARGYTVDTAVDGFGALRLSQDETYDLVFVDYHLPEMDGYALARLLRTLGEKTNSGMKMVAMTADRFGLAARRGVDSVFDRLLTKPIEPDALYAFVEDFLAPKADDLDSFLAEPTTSDAQNAAQVLWRVRGIGTLPTAAVFPEPTADERSSLEYCFRLTEPAAADCLILLRSGGLAGIEAARAGAASFLQPLFCISERDAALSDVVFKVGESESWSAAATALTTFAARRDGLEPGIGQTADFGVRLLAYLFVAERSLVLRRDTLGRTIVPYTGGFAVAALLEAVKRLAGQGLIAAKPGETAPDGTRELVLSLTGKGIGQVAGKAASMPAAG